MKKKIVFCNEISDILSQELAMGNVLVDGPVIANWPRENSTFAKMKNPLNFDAMKKDENIIYSAPNDIHYGWFNEVSCNIHGHLLVGGDPVQN